IAVTAGCCRWHAARQPVRDPTNRLGALRHFRKRDRFHSQRSLLMLRSWFSTWGRPLRPLVGTLPLLMGFCLLVERSPAQWDSPSDPYDPSNLVRVEEDWILLLAEPDANLAAPQLSTQMIRSPDASRFCNFNINFCDIPAYAQGGMQVEAWQGDTCIAAQTSENRNTLGTPNELVTWTQYLQRTDGNTLRFGIGTQETPDSPYYPGPTSSDTWGDFSGVSIDIPQGGTYLGN